MRAPVLERGRGRGSRCAYSGSKWALNAPQGDAAAGRWILKSLPTPSGPMSRNLSLAALAALLGSLFFLPRPDSVRLAATEAGTVLLQPAADGRFPEFDEHAGEDWKPVPEGALWEHLLASSSAERDSDGNVTLGIRGYRMDLERTSWKDQRLHARFFESVQRSLRSIGAEHGFEIEVDQHLSQASTGVVLMCTPLDGALVIEAQFSDGTFVHASREWHPVGALSLLPSFIAILVALVFRRPLLALGIGVLAGTIIEHFARTESWLASAPSGVLRLFAHYLPYELSKPERQQMLLFVACLLAMVGIMARAGGVRALVEVFAKRVRGARDTQVATYLLGLAVFFDHYANAIFVGSTMRPLSDRFRVAREKLAYIVDSTAAPVAGISIFSTWIAFEVSTFSAQLPEAGMAASQGYEVFLKTMPFRFYSLLTLFFVALVAFTGRDFGPMRRAELRARAGQISRDGARPMGAAAIGLAGVSAVSSIWIALLPIGVFLATTLAAILVRGAASVADASFSDVLLRGVGMLPLVLGALLGLVTALFIGARNGLGRGVFSAGLSGLKTSGVALAMLVLAWLLGAVCRDLGTASYLSVTMQEAVNPLAFPMILFLVAAGVAFATGSSWSTMTILLPLVVGLAFELGDNLAIGGAGMMVISVAAVLEGAIFGDHCSPISDTTVMSSTSTSCDHVDHVKTQAPYAAVTMVVALLCGYFPTVVAGVSPWICLAGGASVLTLILFVYGRKVDTRIDLRGTGSDVGAESGVRPAA